jgi:hypothetical protein
MITTTTTTMTAAPDLSLHISPPSPPEPRLLLGLELDDDTAAEAAAATKKADDAAAMREYNNLQVQRRQLHQPSQTAGHGFKRGTSGSAAAGAGGRRSSRAPRMRWTTALHAHFVHAVELLGGHESMSNSDDQLVNTYHELFFQGIVVVVDLAFLLLILLDRVPPIDRCSSFQSSPA